MCLEQSAGSIERLLRNAELNGVADRVTVEKVDAMTDLRKRASEGESYGLVMIDPPAFARKGQATVVLNDIGEDQIHALSARETPR